MKVLQIIRSWSLGLFVIASLLFLRGVCYSQPPDDAAIASPEALQKTILEDKAVLQEEMKKVEALLAGSSGDEERRFLDGAP